MPYRLSSLAERDLDEIWSYVAKDANPTTADRLMDAIVDRFEVLAETTSDGSNYVIYYRHEGDVLIARVLHGRRDQAAGWSD